MRGKKNKNKIYLGHWRKERGQTAFSIHSSRGKRLQNLQAAPERDQQYLEISGETQI